MMEVEPKLIEDMVQEMKAELFGPSTSILQYLFSSAYDTAWVAMVPNPDHPSRPLSPKCLDWILSNQWEGGFWGEPDCHQRPTLNCITATLACLVALKTWKVGTQNIKQGQRFLQANMKKLLTDYYFAAANQQLEWFAIIFPGMLEIAQAKGLMMLPDKYTTMVNHVLYERERVLERMSKSSWGTDLVHDLYFEALPASYRKKHEAKIRQRRYDGMMFRSPSATACAFITTRDESWLNNLKTMAQNCGHGGGVPTVCPKDENLTKMCIVDHLERLGCGEHFSEGIGDIIRNAYSKWVIEEHEFSTKHDSWMQIYEDALSFRLLRMHGYPVSPRRFCWFLYDGEMMLHIEENYNYYLGAMYSIYRATHVMFPQEDDLKNAGVFSRRILCKGLPQFNSLGDLDASDFQIEIESELRLPWLARIDHLEHRKYIERNGEGYVLPSGKSFYRLSFPDNVLQLAKKNFMIRQSTYKAELEDLMRWSKETSLYNMGFGREKTTYCYFAVSTTSCLPLASDVRKIIAKCAILVIVADDLFDEEGSMEELYSLTEAVKRWEGENLSGHSKIIFDVLDDLVTDISLRSLKRHGYQIREILQEIWRETFESWLKEFEWSKSRQVPSTKEYLKVGMISVGVQATVLPSLYLIGPKLSEYYSTNSPYGSITRLLMVSTRLLNDTQSYQKEAEVGKLNMVLLYLKENPKEHIEYSIAYVMNIVEENEREMLALIMNDRCDDMPKEWKELHLSCLKTFRMFYNSSNAFDSPTALLQKIKLAFYEPLAMEPAPHSHTWKKKRGGLQLVESTICETPHQHRLVSHLNVQCRSTGHIIQHPKPVWMANKVHIGVACSKLGGSQIGLKRFLNISSSWDRNRLLQIRY